MAKLKANLTAGDFETLDASLKSFYLQSGENYILDAEGVEDVYALKKNKSEILAEKKREQERADALAARLAEIEAKENEAAEIEQKAAGAFKELEEKLRAKLSETETKAQERENQLLNNFKTERLKNELTARGVLSDRAKYALADIADQVELASDETGFSLKVKNGIGDAKEFDTLIEGLKAQSPFFFAANNASGSGASGSQGNGGNAKTMGRAEYEALDVKAQAAFIKSGGKPVD
jgi:hypothetical protein